MNPPLKIENPSVWIMIERYVGSSPREAGAAMLVSKNDVQGTIGGGRLEFEAIAKARTWLDSSDLNEKDEIHRTALGPGLGQCCGGVVWLRYVGISASQSNQNATKFEALCAQSTLLLGQNHLKIALFGGGHVGKAIVSLLSNLPCQVHWIDSRDEIFPPNLAVNIRAEHSDPVQHAVRDLKPGSLVLIMSFSHAEDLDIVSECLKRQRQQQDLLFIGLIGSKTKWATFCARLLERGFTEAELEHVTCPIGLQGTETIQGKEPEVIALSVVAQLLSFRKI